MLNGRNVAFTSVDIVQSAQKFETGYGFIEFLNRKRQ